MTERRLFPEGTVPDYTTAAWYEHRAHAPHLEEPGHRPRLELAAERVIELLELRQARTVVDLGAGDGGLLSLLAQKCYAVEVGDVSAHGFDLSPANIVAAKARGVDVTLLDVVDEVARSAAGAAGPTFELGDIAIVTEFLEHLLDPHAFLEQLLAADNGRVGAIVASSPWTETTGDAYEFHLWAWDGPGYTELIEGAGWRVRSRANAGMFQVVTATRVDT